MIAISLSNHLYFEFDPTSGPVQLSELPPALTSLIVRYTVKKFSGGSG